MKDKDSFTIQLGVQLRKIRKQKGISLAELGLRGDFDKHALSKIENGKKEITVYSLQKICISLEITIEEFFEGFSEK
ncbi:MAG: helix-turn-helix domain-containing protein [Cytophaga sp.]|uniref:helix-turn-helix domain-containing protein n=1 Tax=Cytophaga sp. TaxID=29535 RepID=UPI003F7E768A